MVYSYKLLWKVGCTMEILDFLNSTVDYNKNLELEQQEVKRLLDELQVVENKIASIRSDFHRVYDPIVIAVDETGELNILKQEAMEAASKAYEAYLICRMHEMDSKVEISAENIAERLQGFANSFLSIARSQLYMTKEQIQRGAHHYKISLTEYIKGVMDGQMDVWSVIQDRLLRQSETINRKESNIMMHRMREQQKSSVNGCVYCGYPFEEFKMCPNYCPDCGKKVEV